VRLVIYDKESGAKKTVKEVREQEVYLGEMPLMTDDGTFVVNGTERVIVSQLHRSPGVFFDHDKGKTHSSGKLLFSARIIPYRGSWLDFEFDPKDCVFARIDRRRKLPVSIVLRALGLSNEEMLDLFFEKNDFYLAEKADRAGPRAPPAPARRHRHLRDQGRPQGHRRGGRRITARHVRELEESGAKTLVGPKAYLEQKILAHDVVDTSTGELLAKANDELTTADGRQAHREGHQAHPYPVRERPRPRPVHLQHAAHRLQRHAPGRARRDLSHDAPGEPPTKDAAENLFHNLFFNAERYDISAVGRMKFNRRVGRDESTGPGVLTKEDIIDALRTLMEIRNGAARSTTSTTWATAACAASARWPRTPSASASCGSSGPSRSA
jgi:DNA-directed RNA polymerase subunit beta